MVDIRTLQGSSALSALLVTFMVREGERYRGREVGSYRDHHCTLDESCCSSEVAAAGQIARRKGAHDVDTACTCGANLPIGGAIVRELVTQRWVVCV